MRELIFPLLFNNVVKQYMNQIKQATYSMHISTERGVIQIK